MHGIIRPQHSIVSPQDFSDRMAEHWSKTLGLVPSTALRTLWRIMAETFETAIKETAAGIMSPWRVAQPATGTGKTQGACVYAAMQAQRNLRGDGEPVGILIVARTIRQANDMVADINRLAGAPVAIATHSEGRAAADDIHAAHVLVITHAAYVAAAASKKAEREAAWSRLQTWKAGPRVLTIIDEALANTIVDNQVTVDALERTLAYIPPEIVAVYPNEVKVLNDLRTILVRMAQAESDGAASVMVWNGGAGLFGNVDLDGFRAAMRSVSYDRIVMKRTSLQDRQRLAGFTDKLLRDAEMIINQFAYFSEQGKEHSLNSSALLFPLSMPGPVVLDATAKANFLWDLFEHRAIIVPTPSHARDYSRVTLHVTRAVGLGKNKMIEAMNYRWPRVISALERQLGPERSLLAVVHKAVEHIPLSYPNHFHRFTTAHWRAVDGRNDWSDYDAALILGLPYRNQLWANNAFFALQGEQDNEWLRQPVWKEHQNVRLLMEQRQLSVAIIQAINRIRCRLVIDEDGHSPPCDIFIVLPKDKRGDAILDDIKADMPGLVIESWELELDGKKVRRPRSGSSHEALISLMASRDPGEMSMSEIGRELGLTTEGLKKLKRSLRDDDHATTAALRDMGITFVSQGIGAGARSCLVKHDD